MWVTLRQTKCLMYKNFLIKKRDKKQFLQELFYPIYMVGILAMIRALVRPQQYPEIKNFPQLPLDNITTNINQSYLLLYSPNNNADIDKIIQQVSQMLDLENPPVGFVNSSDIEQYYRIGTNSRSILGAVIFNSYKSNNVSYTIRMPDSAIPSTTHTTATGGITGSCRNNLTTYLPAIRCPANTYLSSGFATMQNLIDWSITQVKAGLSDSLPKSEFFFQLMPKGAFSGGVSFLQVFVSIYFVMAYAPFVNFLLVGLVTEKEKKIKEGMKMMGLRTSAFWLSWFLTYTLTILISTIVVTIIAVVASLYRASNPFIIFLLLFLYGLSIVTFSFMLTPFFNKATVAGAVGSLSTVAFTALYFPVTLLPTPPFAKWILSLLSPVALALSLSQATALETTTGAQFSTLGVGEFPIGGGILMLIFDTVLYLFLAIYFDSILPKEYGQQYHPLFCFFPSFWLGKSSNSEGTFTIPENTNVQVDVEDISADFQGKEAIRIAGITKSFTDTSSKEKKEVIAVDNFCFDVYEGQITALLGHNGAGKTTLIATLTGLLPTTRGTAYIYNYDINKPEEMTKIREITGVCPQHDILFDSLSAREHLVVFATIKGIPNDQINAAVDKTLEDITLMDKASTRASDLSGGQKRKLSVGIAIIGDPKVIYLDEPTSGMDPLSRRQIWSLLQNRREGKVTLLTTHFMDEADILADRKAVVSHGKLRCAGSSLYLKNRFGIGYHLGMVTTADCNIDKVTELVHEHIPKALLQRYHASELSYLLPLSDVSRFPDLFSHLESPAHNELGRTCAETCGVSSYGISMTTLEEVFLRLKDDDVPNDLSSMAKSPLETNKDNTDGQRPNESMFDFRNTRRLSMKELIRQQFLALLRIRFLVNRRDPLTIIFRVVLPPVFVIVGLIFANNIGGNTIAQRDPPTLQLSSQLYLNESNISPSKNIFADLLIRNSTSRPINTFINDVEKMKLYYQMSNLSADYLLDNYPHTIGYDIMAFQNTSTGIASTLNVLYNDTAVHSIPVAINLINQIRFDNEMKRRKGVSGSIIHVSSKPFPQTTAASNFNGAAFSAPIFIGLALNVIPAGFAIEVTRDRKDRIRQLLRASGVTSSTYWLSLFTCDFISYLFPVLLMLIIIPIMHVAAFVVPAAMGVLFMASLTYMQSNILLAYVASFLFSSVETCQSVLPPVLNLLLLLPTIGVSLLDMLGQANAALILHFVMLAINPTYPIGGAVYFIGQPIIHGAFLFYLLRYLDYRNTGTYDGRGLFGIGGSPTQRPASGSTTSETAGLIGSAASMSEDDDVRAEYDRISKATTSTDVLKVQRLRKEFLKRPDVSEKSQLCCGSKPDKIAAVEDLYFGIEHGEVFGLLGPNGAGKTTTLNIITGDMAATRGDVSIAGYNLSKDITQALRSLGFCPQHDALWERITLSEHLHTYAAIKGVPADMITEAVNRFITGMEIQEHAEKFAKKLSGGTKRKLSFGMSIIGCPRLLLMDEPSTGMDPGAKRFLWNSITASITDETGAVITTHSMEEADALCSRVGIMVRGQLRCLGSTQHLKSKYGGGYHLEVKFSPDNMGINTNGDPLQSVHEFVKNTFPAATEVEHFGHRIIYKIPSSDVKSLARSFACLEESKAKIGIVEYSFSQSTLEQVFLEFAKKQDEETDTEDSSSSISIATGPMLV
ncbi:uncharacterized protein TRIADDRAFT_53677 [Trichoplax adhaerens]|uniref:ABC transporter domain-containing protein n=1 Tax=Trichoplax adhaerens TaxID=10228 RepID=B3RPV5_TRIAD|nr:hypothetical protein TRIADDRAFT_53677 [Trichoplax adhaerens]EDV27708.1 hypothetical protein TRIADDRAFT_53677 [Trichoplax adhaerens]|eukprot:XP_002109542.1 hypothetical protein TRIADDRAFT_53677 [Trichoplax adhaerens]